MPRVRHADPLPADAIPVNQAAALLPGSAPGKRLHCRTLYKWITSKGRLRGWRVGGRWFVSRADVLALARPSSVPVDEQELGRVDAERRREETRATLERFGIRV